MKNTTNRNKVGRPIEKEGRVKIGLSIDGNTNDILSKLAKSTGKTKSRVFEDAIRVLKEREDVINNRLKTIEKLGDEAFLDIDEFIKNRKAMESEKNMRNTG